jgi:hypothetical protein
MKSEAQIKKWISELQAIVDADSGPIASIEARIAYEELNVLRRVIEDVKGWESLTDSLRSAAEIIRRENGL